MKETLKNCGSPWPELATPGVEASKMLRCSQGKSGPKHSEFHTGLKVHQQGKAHRQHNAGVV